MNLLRELSVFSRNTGGIHQQNKNICTKNYKRHQFQSQFRPNGCFELQYYFCLASILLLISILWCEGEKFNSETNRLRVLMSDNEKKTCPRVLNLFLRQDWWFFSSRLITKGVCPECSQHSIFFNICCVLCTELKAVYTKI